MLAKRIIPCLDVKDGRVVKGVNFRNHEDMGDILSLAARYRDEGADELVFYDITASSDGRCVGRSWVSAIAKILDIPFCVAGGIRSSDDAREILASGADKISINSPALENPELISSLAKEFGSQCVVIGIDTLATPDGYRVFQYTGDEAKTLVTARETLVWAHEVSERGAGEIVLNCMNKDGVRNGYDIEQCCAVKAAVSIPIIASGGAGSCKDFFDIFSISRVDGALAASVFHRGMLTIQNVKNYLLEQGICVRP